MFGMFVYKLQKNDKKNKYTNKIMVSFMTEIAYSYDQKYVRGHNFPVGPNAWPKHTHAIGYRAHLH